MNGTVSRFAPSPNGPLHLGHAYAAIHAHDLAQRRGGRFVLRVEDIDGSRSRAAFALAFRTDLAWLGLSWDEVPAQSARLSRYTIAAQTLRSAGLLYPCCCSRADVTAAATKIGPDGPIYPETCKGAGPRSAGATAWRLNVSAAMARTGPLEWIDEVAGPQQARPDLAGDVVLVRKDQSTPASYHLAATLDDDADGVTLVTRGLDLFAATHVHRLLQELLSLHVPVWHHHALVLDETGQKLSKSNGSRSLADMRACGLEGTALAAMLRQGQSPAGFTIHRSLDRSV